MISQEDDYQKLTSHSAQLLTSAKDRGAYTQMAVRQSQEQRIRNADALARARSMARLSKIRVNDGTASPKIDFS